MKAAIQCPQCHKRYQVAVETIGKRVKCAQCATAFVAEQAAAQPREKPVAPTAPRVASSPAATARPATKPGAARATPPATAKRTAAVQAGAPSSLDDLFNEEFTSTAGGASPLANASALASGPALSSGPTLSALPAVRQKRAMSRDKLIKVIVIGIASSVGVVGTILAVPVVWRAANDALQPDPTASSPSSPASPPPPAAQASASASVPPSGPSTGPPAPLTSPVDVPAPTPPQSSEYQNAIRDGLAIMTRMADLLASIHDRPSFQSALGELLANDTRLKAVREKLTSIELRRQRTPADVAAAETARGQLEFQKARIESEVARIQALATQLHFQEQMARLDAMHARMQARMQPAQQPAPPSQPAAAGHAHGPHPPPSHRIHRP